MLINVSPDARTFHLRSRFFSYILTVMENGQIENLYFGKAIQDRPSFAHLHEEAIRGMTAFNAPEPSCLCLNQTRQEYPSYGTTDFRSPAFEVEQQNGSRISAFKFSSYKILKGKPRRVGALRAGWLVNKEKNREDQRERGDDFVEKRRVLIVHGRKLYSNSVTSMRRAVRRSFPISVAGFPFLQGGQIFGT